MSRKLFISTYRVGPLREGVDDLSAGSLVRVRGPDPEDPGPGGRVLRDDGGVGRAPEARRGVVGVQHPDHHGGEAGVAALEKWETE